MLKQNRFQEWPRWKRLCAAAVVSPCLAGALVSAGFYLYLHRSASAMSEALWPVVAAPHESQRILVIAPHCDDETLGAGGLMAEARKRGVPVTVAFLTNGDGFPVACAMALKKTRLKPSDYIRFGELRQKEAIDALGKLGVPEGNVRFLGFPDAGLKALWETNWTPQNPLRSRFTATTASPFSRCFHPGTTYCGQSVVADLKRLIEISRPTDIYVTHPADDHGDHAAAPAFTQAALDQLQESGLAWAKQTRIHYYLIHRGDWPLPQGLAPNEPLNPPAGLQQADTRWSSLPLSTEAQQAKAEAIAAYASQTEVLGRLMHSFIRTNELFGQPSEPQLLAHTPTQVRDAPGDDVVRFANPAADLTGLSVARENDTLRVHLRTRGAVSATVRYTVRVRAENGSYTTRALRARALAGGNTLESVIPLTELGLDPKKAEGDLWVLAETGITSRLVVDQTGYRRFHLNSGTNFADTTK